MRPVVIAKLSDWIGADLLSLEGILWCLMLAALVVAGVDLITMLLTRWGDRRANTKSLIFSLLVHISCGLGVIVVHPDPATVAREEPGESPQRMQVQRLADNNVVESEATDPATKPVWDQIAPPEKTEIARIDPVVKDLPPIENPDRNTPEITRPEVQPSPLRPNVEEPSTVPSIESQQSQPTTPVEIAQTPEINEKTNEIRPDFEVPTARQSRQQITRSGGPQIQRPDRTPRKSAVEATELSTPPVRSVSSTSETPLEPTTDERLIETTQSDVDRNPVGPTPSQPDPVESELPAKSQANTTSDPSTPRITRSSRNPSRPTTASDRDSVPSRMQRTTPGRPDNRTQPEVAIRVDEAATSPTVDPRPNVDRTDVERTRPDTPADIPATYQLRSIERRRETARRYGGTEASEKAVEASLKWLANNQHNVGFWDADRFGSGQVKTDENGIDRRNAGKFSDTGVTALAVLAFLGAGYTAEEGQYANEVERALRWLVNQQRDDGFLGGSASYYARMYCHGMVTYALAEAYGMQSSPETRSWLRKPLERGIAYILANQNDKDGGWRYAKGQDSDMSMFGWQLMALKSAEIAGMEIPLKSKQLMVTFLKNRSLGTRRGLAGYRDKMPPAATMTAESLFCKQMFGIPRSDPASAEAVNYLMQRVPKRSETNVYYWYYGTLAMYQYGGDSWQTWNSSVRDLLIDEQVSTGENTGSWDPNGPWGKYGGRVYSTALSTLCLEVYYRFLPLYQIGDRNDGDTNQR